jgi:hypothetical protein
MENIWLKIKIWTKIILFSIVVVYLLLFIFKNSDQELTIWWWFGHDIKTSALELIPCVLLGGVIGTVVVRMAFRAITQIRDLKQRNATARLNRDMEDIRNKAAMLQTKEPAPPKTETTL